MAIGDQADIVGRIKSTLPPWFGDSNPVVDSIIAGIASCFAWFYSLYLFAKLQARIATSTGFFLDIVSADFYGSGLPRMTGESDSAFRLRIQINFFRERGTRQTVSDAVATVTGSAPVIVEPNRIADTLFYGSPAFGYGMTGNYASRLSHHQAFIRVYSYSGPAQPVYDAVNVNRPIATIPWVSISASPPP